MEKKLCWHNGNLLFMTLSLFLHAREKRHFLNAAMKNEFWGQVFRFRSGLVTRFFFLLSLYWFSNCKDSNECYYLTASWMRPKSPCNTFKWFVSVFLELLGCCWVPLSSERTHNRSKMKQQCRKKKLWWSSGIIFYSVTSAYLSASSQIANKVKANRKVISAMIYSQNTHLEH